MSFVQDKRCRCCKLRRGGCGLYRRICLGLGNEVPFKELVDVGGVLVGMGV